MNENLNLVEILKDCPKGTKLYSALHGEVEFLQIEKDDKYSIICCQNGYFNRFNAQGLNYYSTDNGECILFPSKDQRDWSKFKVEPEMIDGEFYYCFYGDNQKENSFIFIYKKHLLYETKCYIALSMLHSILCKESLITNNNKNITELRRATEEEKQQLLNAIKRDGYKWDADKKELVKIEPKFDISKFQHFDKVLVRDCDTHNWKCDFYDSYSEGIDYYQFKTIYNCYAQCIPYNNETKHLVGTSEMPPKKYITWEE